MNPVSQPQKARRETGGSSPRRKLAGGGQVEETGIEARIVALEALTTADLRIEWRRLYRTMPPSRLSRDLLIRGVAYLLQIGAEGGLSLTTKRRLRTLSEGSDQRGQSVTSPVIRLKPGTKLVREWHGQAHTVSVLDDGFEYQGERYRSLTRIARRITGVHWSGPLFFGISARRRARKEPAREESSDPTQPHHALRHLHPQILGRGIGAGVHPLGAER
jgi:hypothetical protein